MFGTSNCGRRRQFSSTPAVTTENLNAYIVHMNFPLKNYLKTKGNSLSNTDPANSLRMKRLSLKFKKTSGIQKLDLSKKKSTDYTEMAYREAVSKLKYLLAESYVSKPLSGKSPDIKDYHCSNVKINESKEDIDNKSVVMNNCKAKDLSEDTNKIINPQFALCKNIHSTRTYSNLASPTPDSQSVPPELNSFIEQQEEYIHQLQQESQFCRNQLNNLLYKVREVVAENEALHYKNKTGFFKCALDEYAHINENDNKNDTQKPAQIEISENKKPKTLECPNIVFESRISELEAQLTQAKLELRKVQEQNQYNLKQMSENCLSNNTPEMKVQLEKALHTKNEAEMKVQDLQKTLVAVREQETEALQKIKETMDAMQQIQFEKNQYEIEIKRLKEELERQHGKFREATQEASKRIAEERQQIERRYSQQVEQLSADIVSHWDAANKSQLESEKQRIELIELKREVSQKQTFIDDLKKELQNKISNLQSELNQALTEKDGVEQEVLSTKLTAERNERQSRQEQSRLQIEINSYKQRLERTEADLVHLRRENLRLSEHIASLEKEIAANKPIDSDFTTQIPAKSENEKELTSMIIDMETKHAATVTGLEGALNNQATIVSQLTAECQSLTQRLEANNLKHKEEMASLQNNIEYLSDKIQSTFDKQQGVVSMQSKDISSKSLAQAQNTMVPHVHYQEHNMKIDNPHEISNQSLRNNLSNENKYYIDNDAKNNLNTKGQIHEENENQDEQSNVNDHQSLELYVIEQEYNSYDQYNVTESEQQEHPNRIQNPNEATFSQYTTLDT